jgi:hypothetical protein
MGLFNTLLMDNTTLLVHDDALFVDLVVIGFVEGTQID